MKEISYAESKQYSVLPLQPYDDRVALTYCLLYYSEAIKLKSKKKENSFKEYLIENLICWHLLGSHATLFMQQWNKFSVAKCYVSL